MKKNEGAQLRAFIAAPGGKSLSVLKDELTKRNVQAYTAYDLPVSSASIAIHVERAIKQADLIVAVVPEHASPNVFFELGMAHAMKKPLLILVSPNFGTLPSDISETLYLRIDPDNRSALSFALDQCIQRLERPAPRPRKEKKEEVSFGREAGRFLPEIHDKQITGRELENIVAEVFRMAGAEAVIESQHRDEGADIAIWSDALQTIAGNPVLVEVKNSVRSREELLNAMNQVEYYRQNSGSKFALLVVNATTVALSSVPFVGGVLAILLPDLIESLRTKTLAETIRELRNKSAHSGGK
jgi:hypothetical protein